MRLPDPELMLKSLDAVSRRFEKWLNPADVEVVPVASDESQPSPVSIAIPENQGNLEE